VAPRRARSVPNHSSLCSILALTGASNPKAPSAELQVAPAQSNVVVRPGRCELWMSASMPATQGAGLPPKPAWAPKIMPSSLEDVLVATRASPPGRKSLMTVSVLTLPKP
jgi:hypothetical protein